MEPNTFPAPTGLALSPGQASGWRWPRIAAQDLALISLVLIATAVVLGKDITVGGLRDGDTAVHAMDGVLIHDWLVAGPHAWGNPMQFAKEQYGHYPCLGIGRHYPPGFAMVEAGFFALFGISAVTARLCVVFFGLIAAAGTYTFMRTITDRATSILGAVILVTLPAVTFWGRQAMLEVPTLASLTWGAVAFVWYLRCPSWRRYGVMLVVATIPILFRQTGVFFHSAIAMTLMYCAFRRRVPWSHCLGSIILALVAIAAVTLSFEGAGERMFRGRASYSSLLDLGALTFYLRQLPGQVGFAVLGAALVGIVLWPRKLRAHWVFLASWVIVCYVMVSAAELKWPRFFFVGLFPFAVWAAIAAGRLLAMVFNTRWRWTVTALASVGLCSAGFARPVQPYPDYGAVVAAHKARILDRAVLFSGVRDNHFVFAVRQHLPWRRAIAVRGSKLLYVCNTIPSVDFVPLVETPDDLADLMHRFAFTHVFAERNNRYGVAQEAMLRDYLATEGIYRRVASHPLQALSFPACSDTTIDVYELASPLTRSVDSLDIPIPRAHMTVRVALSKEPR